MSPPLEIPAGVHNFSTPLCRSMMQIRMGAAAAGDQVLAAGMNG